MAQLVGFALDQQITVQQAFTGPLRIKQRVGTLDPKTLAGTDLEPVFREKPAVHRFPGTMAKRVQELAAYVAEEYDGDATRIWAGAADSDELADQIGRAIEYARACNLHTFLFAFEDDLFDPGSGVTVDDYARRIEDAHSVGPTGRG